jgi:hypothetical protein
MDNIRKSLDIVQGTIKTDIDSYNFAVNELKRRKEYLTPLFNECCAKGISLKDVCNDINNEWNEINLTLIKQL